MLPSTYARATVSTPFASSEGTGGVVNELLVQMQSFDALTGWQRLGGWCVDRLNLLLPPDRQLRRPSLLPANVLLIAATNRADSLDPALLRPGRFDRRLTFELPAKSGRRALVDHFLSSKAHAPELDDGERRDALAAVTQGYSPVMIEHLLDEALVSAVKRGSREMTWKDVEYARLVEEVGIGAPVEYTDHERRLIATHEAGHATLAWLTAPQRRLEILTIIKRRGSLGLLAHGDREDVFTRSRSELQALVQIAFGGQCAEELFFGDVSTGPGGDLLYATNCAAEMVGAHGMGDSLVSYLAVQNSAFSDTNIVGRVLADDRGRDRVEALLQEQKQVALGLLASHRHLVEALRDALLEHDELVGSEITDVLEPAPPRTGWWTCATAPSRSTDPRGGGAWQALPVSRERLSRAAAYALLLLLTLLAAVWSAFLVPLRVGGAAVPVGVVLALAVVPLARRGGRLTGSLAGAAAPAVLWVVVAVALSSLRREGDLVVTGSARGLAFLVVSVLGAAVGVAGAARAPAGSGSRRDSPGAAVVERPGP